MSKEKGVVEEGDKKEGFERDHPVCAYPVNHLVFTLSEIKNFFPEFQGPLQAAPCHYVFSC
jgi:hypothetical protein